MAGSLRHAAPLGERRQVISLSVLLAACIPFTCAHNALHAGAAGPHPGRPRRPRPIDQSVMDHRTPAGFVFHTTPDVIV